MIKLEDIKFRIDRAVEDKGATVLIYIDARTARRELNERFGFGNWQFTYTVNDDKSVHGVLKINRRKMAFIDIQEDRKTGFITEEEYQNAIDRMMDGEVAKEWLEFHDVGYCSNKYSEEPLKDAVSDATKRCAVQVGIGEILYEAPFLWADWGGLKIGRDKKVKGMHEDQEKLIQSKIEKWYKQLNIKDNK